MSQTACSSPSSAPTIPTVAGEELRPRWSVMIPTWNCARYLRKTLESVLFQDPGPGEMQIEVVDDCSEKDDPQAVVQAVGQVRVGFHRQAQNVGVVGNFNTCLQRSRGELIHILHGDDFVAPGFYAKIGQLAAAHPEAVLFATRSFVVDHNEELQSLSEASARHGNRLDMEAMLYSNPLYTPSVVVRRRFYEQTGGFATELVHLADWEMWIRAAHAGAIFLNEPLAYYRLFQGNDTSRLMAMAENLQDYLRLREILAARVTGFDAATFTRRVSERAWHQTLLFKAQGMKEAARLNFNFWRRITPFPRIAWTLFRWAAYATSAKLKRRPISRP